MVLTLWVAAVPWWWGCFGDTWVLVHPAPDLPEGIQTGSVLDLVTYVAGGPWGAALESVLCVMG